MCFSTCKYVWLYCQSMCFWILIYQPGGFRTHVLTIRFGCVYACGLPASLYKYHVFQHSPFLPMCCDLHYDRRSVLRNFNGFPLVKWATMIVENGYAVVDFLQVAVLVEGLPALAMIARDVWSRLSVFKSSSSTIQLFLIKALVLLFNSFLVFCSLFMMMMIWKLSLIKKSISVTEILWYAYATCDISKWESRSIIVVIDWGTFLCQVLGKENQSFRNRKFRNHGSLILEHSFFWNQGHLKGCEVPVLPDWTRRFRATWTCTSNPQGRWRKSHVPCPRWRKSHVPCPHFSKYEWAHPWSLQETWNLKPIIIINRVKFKSTVVSLWKDVSFKKKRHRLVPHIVWDTE